MKAITQKTWRAALAALALVGLTPAQALACGNAMVINERDEAQLMMLALSALIGLVVARFGTRGISRARELPLMADVALWFTAGLATQIPLWFALTSMNLISGRLLEYFLGYIIIGAAALLYSAAVTLFGVIVHHAARRLGWATARDHLQATLLTQVIAQCAHVIALIGFSVAVGADIEPLAIASLVGVTAALGSLPAVLFAAAPGTRRSRPDVSATFE